MSAHALQKMARDLFSSSMQLGTKRNYKVVEEKLLGFVLVYKLACTELQGSDSFVKCVSRFCVKIRL